MKIALSTDHAGFESLQKLLPYLESKGHECVNYGPSGFDQEDDYPDFIRPAAEAVASGECEIGIVFGGSGQGEAMVANRIPGVRCGVYYGPAERFGFADDESGAVKDEYAILRLNRQHNNANMLSLASRFLSQQEIENAVRIWMDTPYSGEERHTRRNKKLDT